MVKKKNLKRYLKGEYFFFFLKKLYYIYKYIYTINHKRIAINYFFFSLVSGLSGVILATLIRLEMGSAGSLVFKGDSLKYLQVATSHGLVMVFFVVVPLIFGFFANFLVPYHVGSKDVAFPRLNSIGFWIQPFAFLMVAKAVFLRSNFWNYYEKNIFYLNLISKNTSLSKYNFFCSKKVFYKNENLESSSFQNFLSNINSLFEDFNNKIMLPINFFFFSNFFKFSELFYFSFISSSFKKRKKVFFNKCSNRTLTSAGWAFVTPMSSNLKYTGLGAQDLLAVSVLLAGLSTTISFTNLLVTRRILASPFYKNRRILIPFITIALLLTLRMLAIVTPVLAAGGIMLMLDRHWNTFFFDYNYGGDPILFQHLFWFFGHPEVYILIIPAFGFINVIFPLAARRRIGSKHHMVWAIYIMAYMGFIVWGHHMYLVGLDHRTRNIYSIITILISLPATIKVVNWTITLTNSFIYPSTPFFFSISFVFFFLVGGFTGMWLSHVALNIAMHDTMYVIAHFHIMLSGGTITGLFAGLYYYYFSVFGNMYNGRIAILHLAAHTLGIWATFLPLFFLGFSGLPRRVHDFSHNFIGWQSLATSGHMFVLFSIFFFFLTFIDSFLCQFKEEYTEEYIPRIYKRIHASIFSLFYLKSLIKDGVENPIWQLKSFVIERSFSEYEVVYLNGKYVEDTYTRKQV